MNYFILIYKIQYDRGSCRHVGRLFPSINLFPSGVLPLVWFSHHYKDVLLSGSRQPTTSSTSSDLGVMVFSSRLVLLPNI